MSEPEQSSTRETSPGDESAARGMASIERAFLRLTFWQTLLSLAGVFTGAVALYAALNESQAVRQQTSATVWPYVQLMINDTDDGNSAHFALSFENVGVGPARMRGLQFMLDGEAITSWGALTAALLGEAAKVGVDYGRSSIVSRVIAPGESIIAFQTQDRQLAVSLQQAVYSGRTNLRYCYCSIFDTCWQSQIATTSADKGIEETTSCPDYGDSMFQD